jgi:hypothetical protein
MAFALQAGFDIEICDDRGCSRDIYRLADLPTELRELVLVRRASDEIEWRTADGSRWLVRPAFV